MKAIAIRWALKFGLDEKGAASRQTDANSLTAYKEFFMSL
jgi:hypothetical protein